MQIENDSHANIFRLVPSDFHTMTPTETFPRPPISEAILDIQISRTGEFSGDSLEALRQGLEDEFPSQEARFQNEFKFKLGDEPEVIPVPSQNTGYVLKSSDGNKVIQIRHDGFSANWLRPYVDWASMKEFARCNWELYAGIVGSGSIQRIALRYINRIDVPRSASNVSDYVAFGLYLPTGVPQKVKNYFVRANVEDEDSRFAANIVHTVSKEVVDGCLPIMLDIDVYCRQTAEIDDTDMWGLFDGLRDFKNQIFFNCVTETAKDLFRQSAV